MRWIRQLARTISNNPQHSQWITSLTLLCIAAFMWMGITFSNCSHVRTTCSSDCAKLNAYYTILALSHANFRNLQQNPSSQPSYWQNKAQAHVRWVIFSAYFSRNLLSTLYYSSSLCTIAPVLFAEQSSLSMCPQKNSILYVISLFFLFLYKIVQ